jgi:protein-tyrosine phosphatase
MDWIHRPIDDGCIPGGRWEQDWVSDRRIHNTLAVGGRVFIHCEMGRARSGMVAARILMEQGLDADNAIRTIQDCRPGALSEKWQA